MSKESIIAGVRNPLLRNPLLSKRQLRNPLIFFYFLILFFIFLFKQAHDMQYIVLLLINYIPIDYLVSGSLYMGRGATACTRSYGDAHVVHNSRSWCMLGIDEHVIMWFIVVYYIHAYVLLN